MIDLICPNLILIKIHQTAVVVYCRFLRFQKLEEAQRAVSTMNGRILGNNHVVVELASETRVSLSPEQRDSEVLCNGVYGRWSSYSPGPGCSKGG